MECFEIKCLLCPKIDGILKQISKDAVGWAHVVCVNWISDIWFDSDAKTTVNGKIMKKRFDLTCGLCKKKEGSILQCDFKNCTKSFHVRCAIKS